MNKTVVVLILLMIVSTVSANLLLKTGAVQSTLNGATWMTVNRNMVLGGVFFGLSFLLYFLVLRHLPLHIAQAFSALQFILVVVSSAIVLGETITWQRWIGLGLIAAGILVVGVNRSEAALKTSHVGNGNAERETVRR